MKLWVLFLFGYLSCFCQTTLVKNADNFIGVDFFENYYYIQNGVLHKSNLENQYQNIEYGIPDGVDISNPLQILVFYKLFNRVIVLDNRLNSIYSFKTPFGTNSIANAGKDKIWLYNNTNTSLTIYNYRTQKMEVSSLPTVKDVQQLKGNLNQVWILDQNGILSTYNYLARNTHRKNTVNTLLPISLSSAYHIQDSQLWKQENPILKIPQSIHSFEVVNKQCYYFNGKEIYRLSIPKN